MNAWILLAIAAAVARLATHPAPPRALLCMDREPLAWEQVARAVLAATGAPSPLELLPAQPGPPPRFPRR